jgi:hypothetical protein
VQTCTSAVRIYFDVLRRIELWYYGMYYVYTIILSELQSHKGQCAKFWESVYDSSVETSKL